MVQFSTPNVYISQSQVYISYFFTFLLINEFPVFRIFSWNYEFTSCNSDFVFIYLFLKRILCLHTSHNSVFFFYSVFASCKFGFFLEIWMYGTSHNCDFFLKILRLNLTIFFNNSELTLRNFDFSQKCKFVSQFWICISQEKKEKSQNYEISPIYIFYIITLWQK